MCRPRCHAICNPGIDIATEKKKVGASDMYVHTVCTYVQNRKNGIDNLSTQPVRQMIHLSIAEKIKKKCNNSRSILSDTVTPVCLREFRDEIQSMLLLCRHSIRGQVERTACSVARWLDK